MSDITDPAAPPPGTLDDLITDATAVGWEFNERLARDWHRRGLLGSPRREPLGRGRGSDPAVYSSQQRALFQAEARNRAAGLRLPTLAALPVWAWLTYGDDWVGLPQLRRALHTAVGDPRRSQRVAGQTAQLLLALVDHKQGRPGDRSRLRAELTAQLTSGRIDQARLRPRVEAVFEPLGLSVVRGPAGASLTPEAFTYGLGTRMLAAVFLTKITDDQLFTARLQHQTAWPQYQQQRAEFATYAGSLSRLFEETDLPTDVVSSVGTLLLLVGMQMQAVRKAAQSSKP